MSVRPALFVAFAVSLVACGTPPSQDAGAGDDVRAEPVERPDEGEDVTVDASLDVAADTAPDAAVAEAGPDCATGTVLDAGVCAPCPTGFRESGGRCADIDECADGTAGCDSAPAGQCTNTPGAFTCACAEGYVGTGVGVGNCRYNAPSLSSLTGSSGALSPAFSAATTMYALTASGPTVTLTAAVASPTRATIRVNGAVVASGSASPAISVGVIPTPVTVEVTAEGGATRTYTVVVSARSTYLKGANPRSDYQFGGSIALSADGNTLAVGSPVETSPATGINGNSMAIGRDNAGAVFVYTRPAGGGPWSQQAYVKASNTEFFAAFGTSVALSADGGTLAVGAPGERSNATGINGDQANRSAFNSGAVYVFTRAGTTWSQQAYLKASNTEAADYFGRVALSGDGNTLAVGAAGESSNATGVGGDQASNAARGAGAVYVFTRAASVWSQQAYLKASNTGADDMFSAGLSLSGDGNTLAVGASGEDSNATRIGGDQANNGAMSAGAAYVFTRAGSTWSQRAYVKASNSGAGDQFGLCLALSASGNSLAVCAEGEDSSAPGVGGDEANNSATNAGAAYVF